MRVLIYVEGQSEAAALPKLLAHLTIVQVGIHIVPLKGTRFLSEIGRRAAATLTKEKNTHVFACPDLAPKKDYENTEWAYQDYEGLQKVLRRQVRRALESRLSAKNVAEADLRFHPHPFRHDFEVVLLACPELLKRHLRTDVDITKHYHRSPEDQNFVEYPKKIVRRFFTRFARKRYNPVKDCPRILEYATPEDVKRITETCPCFGEFVAALDALATA